MKVWLFALVQSSIALVGITAYFYAEMPAVAVAAGVLAVVVGVAQVLCRPRRLQRSDGVDEPQRTTIRDLGNERADGAPGEIAAAPLPHRATVAALCGEAIPETAEDLLARYDEVVAAIEEKSEDAERGADCLAPDLPSESLGHYLCGLGALAQENDEAARDYFAAAIAAQSGWGEAWLGWAAACYRLEEFAELSEQHPRARGVELLPYDCGSERVLLTLSDTERAELKSRFKQTSAALSDYVKAAKKAMKSRRAGFDSGNERRKSA